MTLDKTAVLTIFHVGSLVATGDLDRQGNPLRASKVIAQTIPVSVEAWNNWSENKPSKTTLRQLPAKLTRHDWRIGHCMDIVADITGNQFPQYDRDFKLEVIV